LYFFASAPIHNVVDNQSKEAITHMTAEVCAQVGIGVDSFINDIAGLCESLSLIAKYCCDYQDMEDTKITSLVEHCFICANEMLKFQHNQGMSHTMSCNIIKNTVRLDHKCVSTIKYTTELIETFSCRPLVVCFLKNLN
jgi:hypothetical protein